MDLTLKTKSILITEDKDLGEWIFSHKVEVNGIIFLRYLPSEISNISKSLRKVIESFGSSLYGKFVVITPDKIRIREMI